MLWEDRSPTLGEPNEGFFYPDPLGFWVEVRRWVLELFRLHQPDWSVADALALTALVHVGDDTGRLRRALELLQPRVVVFLDESSWERSGLEVAAEHHYIPDPHRPGQVYEGFWGQTADGVVVGKSPQHPIMHNLYDTEEMLGFLRAAPLRRALSADAG